ncbi:MAG TPA: hypothetical protein VK718_01825 [Ferruginibacter sp.]|nr:hypothetical protein [Ferruginibacter sp.]
MKKYFYLTIISSALIFASCGSGKTYFTPAIRSKIEATSVPLTKIQYYVDRDIELTRELENGSQTQVTAGTIKFVNGHYMNIIVLKKGTPGVCTMVSPNKLSISFEVGNNNFLNFGRTQAGTIYDPYRVLANSWVSDYGIITYEGKEYHIEPSGTNAGIMIKTKWLRTDKVDVRKMKGRTVNDSSTTPQ